MKLTDSYENIIYSYFYELKICIKTWIKMSKFVKEKYTKILNIIFPLGLHQNWTDCNDIGVFVYYLRSGIHPLITSSKLKSLSRYWCECVCLKSQTWVRIKYTLYQKKKTLMNYRNMIFS